jgi:hypothetical protein
MDRQFAIVTGASTGMVTSLRAYARAMGMTF